MEVAKLASINTLHNLLFLNLFIAVSMVAALGNAMRTSDAMCSVDSRCPVFAIAGGMNVFNYKQYV